MTHWKLVPVEPENEMINAALCAVEDQQGKHLEDLLADAYIAMLNAAPQTDAKPVGKFAKFTDGIWREVTKGSPGVPLYEHPPAADVQELLEALRQLCSIVEIHQDATGNNFAWAELPDAFEALKKWEGK